MNQKLAILFSGCYVGGFISSLTAMIRALQEKGYSITLYMYNHDSSAELMKEKVDCDIIPIPRQNHMLAYRMGLLTPHYLYKQYIKKDAVSVKQMKLVSFVKHNIEPLDLTEYDAVISWEENQCNDVLAYQVKAKKKIAYIHPDYVLSGFDRKVDLPVLEKMDRIVSVSEATVNTLKEVFPEYQDKIVCVPNILDTETIDQKSNEKIETFPKSSFDIVTVCRLSIYHKGLDRLVYVAKRLQDDGVAYEWYICGDGDDRKKLETLIETNQLSHVHLLGAKSNPYPFMKQADLFVLLSNYEGKPVVIDEAMYLSVPCLVTNYASAGEQIQNEDNSWIVPMNDEECYEKLKEVILYPEERKRIQSALLLEDKTKYTNIEKMIEVIE